jgi:putative transposase
MESQPIKIKNEKGKGVYIPDAWARFNDGKECIFDVKHHIFFESIKHDAEKAKKWELRKDCIKRYCDKNRLLYLIITSDEIFRNRLDNIQIFRKNKQVPILIPKIEPLIIAILNRKGSLSRIDLAFEVSNILKIDIKEVIPSIDHLIYFDLFLLDFNIKITDDTVLSLKGTHKSKIVPLYNHLIELQNNNISKQNSKELSFTPDEKEPDANSKNLQEFYALPEKIQLEIRNKIELLKVFDNEGVSTEFIIDFAKKNQISRSTLYYWRNKYEKYGWTGLIPDYSKKGRKKKFSKELEDLIQKVIEEKYLTKLQPSIKGCYRFLKYQCEKIGIKPPSYTTFYYRIQEVSNKKVVLMRKGRKMLRDQFRSLNGKYPFGSHPLDIVEFDHTILDIMLVDRIDRKPIGRPVLTIAIDVYSRMIYGYYLSFDPPSLIAVGMAFLTGILPKDDLTECFKTVNLWPICGIPKRILLDNAKEFRSGGLFNFCKLYDIEMIFNPPKKPDTKPHVERVFRTINNAIRDDLIEGYILPLTEKRKAQYDPEKKAEMTIEEFEKWLVHWIVDYYHLKIHTGIKEKEGIEINPIDRYEQGLTSSNGITIGLPEIPLSTEQLRYDVLPFKRRLLNRSGIRIFGMGYNSPIISQLRAMQRSQTEKYIIKYDPRDIREIYLWAEPLKQYYNIPLKELYFSQLHINPEDPLDYPISLKELEFIKKNRVNSNQITQPELMRSLETRQEMIKEARNKTKTAKKARKTEEIKKIHKSKATSMEIRRRENTSLIEEDFDLNDELDDKEIVAYPTEWEDVKNKMNLLYFDEEEEDI